jgi:hypothetical protein
MLSVLAIPPEEIENAKKRFMSRYEFATYQATDIEGAVINAVITLMKENEEKVLRPKEISEQVDSALFDEEKDFMSKKQKATLVGRIINKFNLATKKLDRDNQGERYLFSKIQLQKIHDSYFAESEEKDTQICTKEKVPITNDIFSDTPSVS